MDVKTPWQLVVKFPKRHFGLHSNMDAPLIIYPANFERDDVIGVMTGGLVVMDRILEWISKRRSRIDAASLARAASTTTQFSNTNTLWLAVSSPSLQH
jgi:hypothetical protein